MFQNISDTEVEEKEDIEEISTKKNNKWQGILKNIFAIQNIVLYIITAMASTVSIMNGLAPFGLAIFAAACSNGIVAGGVFIASILGTVIGFGTDAALKHILTLLIFTAMIFVIKPKYQEETKNEQMKVGMHLILTVLLVQISKMFWEQFLVIDLISAIMQSLVTYIFYKIFVNSIPVIKEFGTKKVFSAEEAIGASLIVTIAIAAIGDFEILGFSVRNILSILLVLTLGWKNGTLIGATTGITIGVVLGILGIGEPALIAIYAVSGMLAGVLNKFGKIGVIIGFGIGLAILTYMINGNISYVIYIKELLIASIGLLLMPKNISLNISDIIDSTKYLPVTKGNMLGERKDTIFKLNTMSDTISEMAKSYEEAAATVAEDEDTKQRNKQIFIEDMLTSLEAIPENILYDDLINVENGILDDIFERMLQKDELEREDLIEIFEKHNSYIIGVEDKEASRVIENNIFQALKNINYTYAISKINFVWKQRVSEDKKNVSKQLSKVSEAISNLADDIERNEEIVYEFSRQIEEIRVLLKQKDIELANIEISQDKNKKYTVVLKTKEYKREDISKIEIILSRVLNEVIKKKQGTKDNVQIYQSADRFKLQVGISRTTKNKSKVSGDSSIQTKLNDGKYLLAISDGMGSGEAARRSSKMAVNMLENLLVSGFDKDISIELINSALAANAQDDMYATLDVSILDLYSGNIEFIKTGACPTYIKTNDGVKMIQEPSAPAGMLNNIELVTYDKDLEDGDIIVMCSDGIIESKDGERANWLKEILEELITDNVQKIADIIIREAIDNTLGVAKDDMTIIVARVENS